MKRLVLVVGMASIMLGLMVLWSPNSVQGLAVTANLSINPLDTIIRSQPGLSGLVLLSLGFSLCLIFLVK